MKTKDFIPGRPESMYEIGYYLFGRKIIFVISFMLALLNFGTIIGLLKIFGGICSSLVRDIFSVDDKSGSFVVLMTNESFWMIALCLAITPICLMKEIEELYIVTVLLFSAIMAFFFTLFL
jgi:amino acid permease